MHGGLQGVGKVTFAKHLNSKNHHAPIFCHEIALFWSVEFGLR